MSNDGASSKTSKMSGAHNSCNVIRVKLIKQKHGGLGFLVKQRTEKPFVVVTDLVAGGIAEKSGLVQVGDVLLRINDIDLTEMGYDSAVEILKAVPMDAPVVLLLKGPEGYSTHLETTFRENGLPKTVRITKPLDDSLVGRIKRTFSSSPSPLSSPVRSFKILCNGNSASPKVSRSKKDKNKPKEEEPSESEANIVSLLRDAVTQTADAKYAMLANGGVEQAGREKATDETVLDNGSHGSPKIVLTTPKVPSNGPDASKALEKVMESEGSTAARHGSPSRRTIEIVQDNDEITVRVKGDVRVTNDQGEEVKSSSSPASTPADNGGAGERRKLSVDNTGKKSSAGHEAKVANGDLSDDEGPKRTPPRKSSAAGLNSHRITERRGSATLSPSPKKYTKLRNVADEKTTMDVLHQKATDPTGCSAQKCIGSIMTNIIQRGYGQSRPKDELLTQAKDFIEQYHASIKRLNTPAHHNRWKEVAAAIERTGTYELTTSELTFGAKTAWRNAPRCIGRIQWTKLQVFDARHINTARGMFEALCNHIKYGTNKGNLRSAITIFPPRVDGKHDYRVWNAQLVSYAGYRQPDGSVIGDPINAEFTEVCQKLGWKGKGGMFDVLPLVLSANGQDPEMFEIPPELILEIPIKHPKYPWFADLGLKWYALPAVSAMLFDCGGLEFTAAPFNGWYMGTEIGARDFCDNFRYNMMERVAQGMGLDTRKSSSLWKDRACVEINIAVLHSYQTLGVTITDHHAAAESFMKHLENEQRLRGGCPADWVWVVPPISGSLTPVFHQEMLLYKLRPSYEYQEAAWKTHVWKKDRDKPKSLDRPKKRFGFKELARAVKFSAKLMGRALARRVKCTIMYATETGKSERFARTLCEIFKHAFDAKVVCMDDYDVIHLEHEALVLVVTSTFGNGDPPENGEAFSKSLYEMKHPEGANGEVSSASYIRMSTSSEKESRVHGDNKEDVDDNLNAEVGPLSNVRYSVFGLGSRAYPNFCAFANFMNKILGELGAERIYKLVEGDEMCGQEESFRNWAQEVFKAACETFCLGDDINMSEATGALSNTDQSWSPGKFRITPMDNDKEADICEALSKLHSKTVLPCKLMNRKQLQSNESTRQTILVTMDTQGASELMYSPGDHVGVFPANNPNLVTSLLARLHNAPSPDQVIKVEVLQEKTTPLGTMKNWVQFDKMPVCSLREAFTRYLDLTTPPSQALLQLLATLASRDQDRECLEQLATDSAAYEEWKYEMMPTLPEVLDEFPSLKVPPSLLLTQLPLLQQRYYSISSSPFVYPGEIHATIAVVTYRTQGGAGPLHEGVCSCWLNRSESGEVVPCTVRAAPSFRLPEDGTLPIILVGPGTGIAPFRSFWQQRKIDREMHPAPVHGNRRGWGEMSLYFGCRQANIDNIYEDELKQMKTEGVVSEFYVALSREPGQPKVYVQDLLRENAAKVYQAIVKDGGHFYVCGDVSMASDVTNTLEKILQDKGGMRPSEAKKFVIKLRDANRFHEDIFGVNIKRSTEGTDKSRDQSKRAWKFINATSKPQGVKEVATPIPPPENLSAPGKPKAPVKNVFMKQRVAPEQDNGLIPDN